MAPKLSEQFFFQVPFVPQYPEGYRRDTKKTLPNINNTDTDISTIFAELKS